jgi:hypothetical protein
MALRCEGEEKVSEASPLDHDNERIRAPGDVHGQRLHGLSVEAGRAGGAVGAAAGTVRTQRWRSALARSQNDAQARMGTDMSSSGAGYVRSTKTSCNRKVDREARQCIYVPMSLLLAS